MYGKDKSKSNVDDPFYVNSIPLQLWEEWEQVTKPFKEASRRKRERELNKGQK